MGKVLYIWGYTSLLSITVIKTVNLSQGTYLVELEYGRPVPWSWEDAGEG